MLVLSRKKNESIILYTTTGERIEIKLVDCNSSRSQLGITAPPSVRIVRAELEPQT